MIFSPSAPLGGNIVWYLEMDFNQSGAHALTYKSNAPLRKKVKWDEITLKWSEMSIEVLVAKFKYFSLDDSFDDNLNALLLLNWAQARYSLGRICTYATAHLIAQFRTHLFSILVFLPYAHLLIWNRTGVYT